MPQHPIAFMSYVRFDDQHENGRLTEFCTRLSGEVRMQAGDKFHIFQDRNDIAWGQQWGHRINQSLDTVTFLIPIITPGFFKSPPCLAELQRFLQREKTLNRNNLILPVYYVECSILHDEVKRNAHPLAGIIAERQYTDWRDLRFEPFTSPHVGKALAKMARQIVETLEQDRPASPSSPAPSSPPSHIQSSTPAASKKEPPASADPAQGPAPKTEPPTRVVDALHRGNHSTLTEALRAAKPGDRILVRPGLYTEGVVIDKSVEIIGDGKPGEVVFEASGKDVILFQATMGRIANLTLRQTGGGKWYCVDIAQGRLELEACDISSNGLACVAIRGGADPRLRRNLIHNGKQGGIYLYDNSQGTLEDNDIFDNAFAGIEIKTGNPTLRRNRIHNGDEGGIMIHENAQPVLEENDIFSNALAGVSIKTGANPTLRRNRIHDGKSVGVSVQDNGRGIFEDNEISSNASSGVDIKTGASPTLRRNRIIKNGHHAISIYDGGAAKIEDNDLRQNTRGPWHIAPNSLPNLKRSKNLES